MSSSGYANALRRGSQQEGRHNRQQQQHSLTREAPFSPQQAIDMHHSDKRNMKQETTHGGPSAGHSSNTEKSTDNRRRHTHVGSDRNKKPGPTWNPRTDPFQPRKQPEKLNSHDPYPSFVNNSAARDEGKARTHDLNDKTDFPPLMSPEPVVSSNPSLKRKPNFQNESKKPLQQILKKEKNATKQQTKKQKRASPPKDKRNSSFIKQEQSPPVVSKRTMPPPKTDQVAKAKPNLSQEPVQSRQGGGTELLAMVQKGQDLSSGRQRLHPRKKQFTTLKKKILQERLEQWKRKQQLLEPGDNDEMQTSPHDETRDKPHEETPTDVATLDTVCLIGFCTWEELQDVDEKEELLANLSSMATKIGPVRDVFFQTDHGAQQHESRCPAFVVFCKPLDAQGAVACWDGFMLGGQRLQARILKIPSLNEDTGTKDQWRHSILEFFNKSVSQLPESTHLPQDDDNTSNTAGLDTKPPTTADATNKRSMTTKIVVLDNVLTPEDFEDEDGLAESLMDIRTMAETHGSVVNLEAQREDFTIHITYKTHASANGAVDGFSGTVIGGQIVAARLREATMVSTAQQHETACITTIALDNVLTKEDLGDTDSLEECLQDLRAMAEEYGVVKKVHASKATCGTVLVTYQDSVDAETALKKFSGVVIGGQTVLASPYHDKRDQQQDDMSCWIVLTNVLTPDDLEDQDCLEETKSDVAALARRYGRVSSVQVDAHHGGGQIRIQYSEDPSVASMAASKLNGMVVGGQTISAAVLSDIVSGETIPPSKPEPATVSVEEKQSDDAEQQAVSPMFSGDKLIPERFAECKRVPKVPRVAPGPRHYATLVSDTRVKPLLVEMLGELMRLQNRATQDKNAKARRRVVMGLREVARGIRSHKVKLVVMANNLDEYGAIDDKLQGILDVARQEDVPVFFEFSKRTLGKAVGKKIKVAVVGIQNAEGAHQQFKKLIQLAPTVPAKTENAAK